MRPKQLQFVNGRAKTAAGDYLIIDYVSVDGSFGATGPRVTLGHEFVTEAEARAACQAHFDQLWRDMTDMEDPKS